MDDLPTLTDSLLGSREEWARWEQAEDEGGPDDEDGKGRKRRK
jgi:dTMP kinase